MRLLLSLLCIPYLVFAMDAEESKQAEEILDERLKTYKKNILAHSNDRFRGFGSDFTPFNEETLLARLTPEKVLFYAHLSDFVYTNKHGSINDIRTALYEKHLKDIAATGYKFVGTRTRNQSEELSAILLYNESENHLIIVFRGSVTSNDWILNSQFLRYSGEDPSEAFTTLNGKKLNIHSGIAQAYMDKIEEFEENFQTINEQFFESICQIEKTFQITTMGHSLGGALALIAANHLMGLMVRRGYIRNHSKIQIETVTFGAPLVFDQDSSTAVEENLGGKQNIINFIHEADPVPRILKAMFGRTGISIYHSDVGTRLLLNTVNFLGQAIFPNLVRELKGIQIIDLLKHRMCDYIEKSPDAFQQIKSDLQEFSIMNKLKLSFSFLNRPITSAEFPHAKHQLLNQLVYKRSQRNLLLKKLELHMNDKIQQPDDIHKTESEIKKIEDSIAFTEKSLKEIK